jgi:hypothetical protein
MSHEMRQPLRAEAADPAVVCGARESDLLPDGTDRLDDGFDGVGVVRIIGFLPAIMGRAKRCAF